MVEKAGLERGRGGSQLKKGEEGLSACARAQGCQDLCSEKNCSVSPSEGVMGKVQEMSGHAL